MGYREVSEIRDGMRIDWDAPVPMEDGLVLRADVYRPVEDGRYPVILTYGPYGKWLHFEDLYVTQWRRMCEQHPDVPTGSTNKYQNWEVVDPEKWVPDGYAVVRVDSRGAGRSPGLMDLWSLREARDFYHCIEWAAKQHWSNGKVGLNGISYYAMNQWQVAALGPPHLSAICVWEGAADYYRDLSHHGGIYCTFADTWFPKQVISVQNGQGSRGYRSRMNGDWVSGPETLREEELGAARRNFAADCYANALASDEYWRSRMPDWSKAKVPVLSSANWGGQGLHPRGNFEGFVRAAASEKWLEVHGIEIEVAKRRVRVNGQVVDLTDQEFRLLLLLAAHTGIVFSREALLEKIWRGDTFVTVRSVDTLVKRLRRRIEIDPANPQFLLTVWGVGYKFADI